MPPIAILAARIRDAVNAAADGHVHSWVALRDIEQRLHLTDGATIQAAIRHAADEGWLRTGGSRAVHSVAITSEGLRTSRRLPPRKRPR